MAGFFDRFRGKGDKDVEQKKAASAEPTSDSQQTPAADAVPEEPSFPPPAATRPGVFGPRPARPDEALSAPQPKKERTRRPIAPLSGFIGKYRSASTRPRYILWSAAAVIVLAAVMIVALGVTSTRWFCAEGCHKVQDDTILAYEASVHSEISCMACHMPVGASPVTFLIHKAEALGELYLTVTNDFHLPLNAESHYALAMHSEQCTQCHGTNRPITPSAGIIIDHAVHAEKHVDCAVCHNRVAHVENFELTLTDPQTGEPNRKHEDFMEMTACFRCHTQEEPEGELGAPGACELCHTPGFKLKPASHLEEGFYPEAHGDLGNEAAASVASATAEGASEGAEAEGGHGGETVGTSLPKVNTINECYTCHSEEFCSDCHGVPMPHPADFQENHAEAGEENPDSCVLCHGPADRFCDDCHHGSAMGWEIDQSRTWIQQHMDTTRQTGASACFDCHNPTYCANCHVSGGS